MTLQFPRICNVVVTNPSNDPAKWFTRGGNRVTIKDLRVQFKVSKTLTKDPNTCDITITNLNKNSRAELEHKPLIVDLYAGYGGEARHVYTGDLRFGASTLKAPDWETTLQLGSGDRAFRFARVNKAYRRGVSVYSVLQYVAGTMGLVAPTREQLVASIAQTAPGVDIAFDQYNSGVALSGYARDELTRLLAPYGYHWSIQDTSLVVLRDEQVTQNEAAIISQDDGMMGSPEMGAPERPGTKTGDSPTVKVKCRLSALLIPGQPVKIQSKAVNGLFKLTKVTHVGDTHGDDWTTEIEGKPV